MTRAKQNMSNVKEKDERGQEASCFASRPLNCYVAPLLHAPRGYCVIGLDNPKTSINVGSVLRAAGCYGAAMVAASGKRYRTAQTDTEKAYRRIPFLQVEDLKTVIPYDCVPVAVDLIEGATPLTDYQHPQRAFYIFGAEDATLGSRITDWCRDVIYVPTHSCMNLAATVNVILYDRLAKATMSKKAT
jgi:tRNA(Leu) C34 or U34 (ribose-2'-O)-methylase TrmL